MNVHSIGGMPESRCGISCTSRGSYIFLGSRGNVAWLPIEIAWTRGDQEEEGKGEGGRRDMVFIAEWSYLNYNFKHRKLTVVVSKSYFCVSICWSIVFLHFSVIDTAALCKCLWFSGKHTWFCLHGKPVSQWQLLVPTSSPLELNCMHLGVT